MFFKKIILLKIFFIELIIIGCSSNFFSKKIPISSSMLIQNAPLGEVVQNVLPFPSKDCPFHQNDGILKKVYKDSMKKNTLLESIPQISDDNISGVWKVSFGKTVCQIATPKTKFGKGYRAWPLHCKNSLTKIASWKIYNSKLFFYDKKGEEILVFDPISRNQFYGLLSSGESVFLSR